MFLKTAQGYCQGEEGRDQIKSLFKSKIAERVYLQG